jgi:TrpR-related protein YerC/YecD
MGVLVRYGILDIGILNTGFMAKFQHPSKLPKVEQEELLFEFGEVLSSIKNPVEALSFLKDLLSSQEAEMLAKRLKIAEYLIAGHDYGYIEGALRVGSSTIARVNEWLKYSGDGYRLLLERRKEGAAGKRKVRDMSMSPWAELRRRYPIMFWPQVLLEEFIAETSARKKRKLRKIVEKMDQKSEVYKRLDNALRSSGDF